jgi:hypothetical protein
VSDWSAWWGATLPPGTGSALERLVSRQPVAHALGQGARILWAIAFLVLPWWAAPTWLTVYVGTEWQLMLWEPKPDNTYAFLWLVLDVVVEAVVMVVVTVLAIAFGARWPSPLQLLQAVLHV